MTGQNEKTGDKMTTIWYNVRDKKTNQKGVVNMSPMNHYIMQEVRCKP